MNITLILNIVFWLIAIFFLWLVFEWTIMRFIRHYFPFPAPLFITELIDNPIRRNWLQNVKDIVKRMELTPSMQLLEIGFGKGKYTEAIASYIPSGKLFAVDINEKIIAKFQKRITKSNITNIIPQLGDVYNLNQFSDNSIDRIYSISAFPEIPDHIKALREMKRVLKPNGLIVFSEIWIDPDFPLQATEIKWSEQAGLKLDSHFGHWYQYQLQFKK